MSHGWFFIHLDLFRCKGTTLALKPKKVRDNFELYDKILIKIVDSTKVEPISFQDLYDSLFSIQALNPDMQNFKFEDLIIEDKNQPHKNGMLFILQYFVHTA